ncbi:hypothetical protein FACS1894186_7800 [Alphaproteobacteria bacterium]|nr:hypothetical protein FACS1894186_7800 [Alphaproteobacteria bacterium]
MADNLNPEIVEKFGTPVVSGTKRYVVPLEKLDEPLHFTNPKDAGTEYGDQNLKGDGKDIMLLNGLSDGQIKGLDDYLKRYRKPENMDAAQVKEFLGFLAENGYDDRYCSDQKYMAESLRAVNPSQKVGMYARTKDVCYAAAIPEGTTYDDGEKTQAAQAGALFIVSKSKDENGKTKLNGRITNVAGDYETVNPGEKIATYDQAKRNAKSAKAKELRTAKAEAPRGPSVARGMGR